MAKTRHLSMSARKQRLLTKRRNQLFPFNEDTTIAEFIKPKYYNRLQALVVSWEDWLKDKIPEDRLSLKRLDFDWKNPDCTLSNVCTDLAGFFVSCGGSIKDTLGTRAKGVPWKVGEFMRYLTSEEHGNFGVSEKRFNALINKRIQEIFNKI